MDKPTKHDPIDNHLGPMIPHYQEFQWNLFQPCQPIQQPEQLGLLSEVKAILKQSLEDVSKIQRMIETSFNEMKTEPKFEN